MVVTFFLLTWISNITVAFFFVLFFLAFFHVSFPLSNTPDPSELVSDYFLKKINSFIIELVIKLSKFKEIKQKLLIMIQPLSIQSLP